MTDRETTEMLTRALTQEFGRVSPLVLPRSIPEQWSECDVLRLMKSDYWIEYEVKVSVADFRKDAEKTIREMTRSKRSEWTWVRKRGVPPLVKHAALSAKAEYGPNRFFYVTPVDMLTLEDIPEFAGWIEVKPSPRKWQAGILSVKKNAPLLHKEKICEREKERLYRSLYHKYLNIINKELI